MRWLLEWHRLTPPQGDDRMPAGEEAVLAAIEQMEGFEAPAAEWERSLLPARVPNYDPRWLDNLCLAGVVGWGRVSPHPAWQKKATDAKPGAPRRVIPTSAAPICGVDARHTRGQAHRRAHARAVSVARGAADPFAAGGRGCGVYRGSAADFRPLEAAD